MSHPQNFPTSISESEITSEEPLDRSRSLPTGFILPFPGTVVV